MASARGTFITFEGGEGSGKSTQAKILATRLRDNGHEVVLTREPGGSPGAEAIRALLVTGEAERWTPLTETLLFLAARADHVAKVIAPALEKGAVVICDRFVDSTFVYQGIARGLGTTVLRGLLASVPNMPTPDLTFILDIDPREGLKRSAARANGENRFEKFDTRFHDALRAAFRDIASAEPQRCLMLDASRPPEAIGQDIERAVDERLALAKAKT
jgi:dTMP kinase